MFFSILSIALLLPGSIHAVPVAANGDTPLSDGANAPAIDGTYLQTVLDHHNIHRANHSAPNLVWSHHMAHTAYMLAKTCKFNHNTSYGGGGYGQNIAAGTPPAGISDVITNQFYNGEEPLFTYYGQPNPDNYDTFESWGHFTQVVWKHTAEVGCFTYNCAHVGGVAGAGENVMPWFTVCNYYPPGNIMTWFGAQVGKPLGHPSITGKYVPPAAPGS